MPADKKTVLWISITAIAFILVLVGLGFFIFIPSKGEISAPASPGNSLQPKTVDSQDYLSNPPPLNDTTSTSTEGGTIIVYGDQANVSVLPDPKVVPLNQETIPSSVSAQNPSTEPTIEKSDAIVAPTSVLADITNSSNAKAPQIKAAPPSVPKRPIPQKTLTKVVKPKKSDIVASIPSSRYWIQAASFSNRGQADTLRDNLAGKGFGSSIYVKNINGVNWYRVNIGPFSKKIEADGWVKQVKQIPSCSEAFVTRAVL